MGVLLADLVARRVPVSAFRQYRVLSPAKEMLSTNHRP